jgi:hypothetical protein
MPDVAAHTGERYRAAAAQGVGRALASQAQPIANQSNRVAAKLPRVPPASLGLAIPLHSPLPELAKLAQHRLAFGLR